MGWDGRKTTIVALAVCLVTGAALFIALGGGGEAKPTSDEVDTAYLRFAQSTRELTFKIDRATEDPPDRPRQLAREFRSFAGRVDYAARFLMTLNGVGPVPSKALVTVHSLSIYEDVLRWVAKLARGRALERGFRDVRSVGAEVRITGAALERALRADIAD